MQKENLAPYLRRLIILVIVTSIALFAINEITFIILNENIDRAPMRIELLIPLGTAERVAMGEEVASIPDEMVFIMGDVLVVNNQDTSSHELGPVFVPPGASASLALNEADRVALACSFRPSKYLGLTIKEPTNILTRIAGLLFAVPPTVAIVFLYSLVVRPLNTQEGEELDEQESLKV